MRTITFFLSFAILATFLVRNGDAVACESLNPDLPDGCTNCEDELNVDHEDCVTTTTERATTTTTTTTVRSIGTVTLRPNRKIVRLTNLQYTNVRRVRVNRNGNTSRNAGRRNMRNGNTNRRPRNGRNVFVVRG
ncbi:integrator complex subunit 5-like protein [Drosophila innubila]|uniref:integrator complex subunit 5-like protein n=1 Tax=Drosophila innubila TaxID=198719 RepID=UPI00148D14E9|nr:integrator complex subunit 5-like protein [Drosophila innubila]